MAKFEPPANIEIAALRTRRLQDVDLMASGPGTPWEDRGSHGPVGGFLKTAGLSLTSPVAMYEMLRRPNSTKDSNGFLLACGGLWSVAMLLHAIISYVRRRSEIDATILLPHFVLIAAAPFILYGLLNLATNVFTSVAEGELKTGTPRTLAANIFSYAAGPSVLAPFVLPWQAVGPINASWLASIGIIAIVPLWIGAVAAVGARSRMRLSLSGAVIAVLLALGTGAALATGAYFGLSWLWALITL